MAPLCGTDSFPTLEEGNMFVAMKWATFPMCRAFVCMCILTRKKRSVQEEKNKSVELTVFKSSSLLTQHLEQEKHELRRRFENREGEWEGRVSELESDVKQLQDELERQHVHLREADREKTRAVQELSEQNQRLLDQLSRVSHKLRIYGIKY